MRTRMIEDAGKGKGRFIALEWPNTRDASRPPVM